MCVDKSFNSISKDDFVWQISKYMYVLSIHLDLYVHIFFLTFCFLIGNFSSILFFSHFVNRGGGDIVKAGDWRLLMSYE